jgi:thymidylate synthase (FAD)
MKINTVKFVSITPDAEKLIAYCARVSNPSNQTNDNYANLIKYCIKNRHWSIFEQATLNLEITTTRGLAAQILRHRSFSFQEFCMSGDTLVYFDLPNATAKNKRQLHKLSLEHLYNNWTKDEWSKNRIKNMNVRIFDQKEKILKHAHIKEVFQTGVKDVFEISLENKKTIKCTKEHKVLTENGFVSLEDAIGLKLINNIAVMTNNTFIGCNGVSLHQSYNWMKKAKKRNIRNKRGLRGIAEEADVSYHTIRKWLKVHKLSFSKKEVAKYTPVWNTGIFGYSTGIRSEETKAKMRASAKRGPESNLWKGGVSSERKMIQVDIEKYRKPLLLEYNYCCGLCKKKIKGSCDLHHIVPVSEDASLAREKSNLMPTHHRCHMKHHKKLGHQKKWREKSKGNALTICWSKVKYIKYLGKQMTYDLEIDHSSHNYVADGVIVHNSQRYADVSFLEEEIPMFELRGQDTKNRQNSLDNISDELKSKYGMLIREHFAKAKALYDRMLNDGIAKESARFVLPLATPTRLYMNGTIRSWITYIALREKNGTQKEHQIIAKECKSIFCEHLPLISEALGGVDSPWEI